MALKDFLDKGIFIIAEAGVNHNGDVEIAKGLIEAAKEAGADAVKFQTFVTENSISTAAELAPYQKENLKDGGSQFAMAKALELPLAAFAELKKHAEKTGILFLSTPEEDEGLDFLVSLGLPLLKIGSGDLNNYPFLARAARTGLPLILSTGMATMEEIEQAVATVRAAGCDDIALLHCTTEYPAPLDEVNLRAMRTLAERFHLPAGYSDHTIGIEIAVAAAALGAAIIEKHFTLDKTMEGPDHVASLEPAELAAMVQAIRAVEKSLGDGIKRPGPGELKNRGAARKSIVAARDIAGGAVLTEKDLALKKPGWGIPPGELTAVVGRRLLGELRKDEVLTWEKLDRR